MKEQTKKYATKRGAAVPAAFAYIAELEEISEPQQRVAIGNAALKAIRDEVILSLRAWRDDPLSSETIRDASGTCLGLTNAMTVITVEGLQDTFERLGDEYSTLLNSRAMFAVRQCMADQGRSLTGLALSGGGIRSASFCLGVLQALGNRGLLQSFDYVSGVSGGGYIASWLTTWAYRHKDGVSGVEKALDASQQTKTESEIGVDAGRDGEEVEPIRWIRRHGTYLAPRSGIFAIDSWALIVTYVRNLFLHSLIVVPILGTILAIPMGIRRFAELHKDLGEPVNSIIFLALLSPRKYALVILWLQHCRLVIRRHFH